MTCLICHHNDNLLPKATPGNIPVLMYGATSPRYDAASIGNQAYKEVKRLGVSVPQTAIDFLTISMAVTAADTFVVRENTAQDGWARDIRLVVPIGEPQRWEPATRTLEKALRFLSGDNWEIELHEGGPLAPSPRKRGNLIKLDRHSCVCLFSGGLDSAIGALDLLANQELPLLVSHSYRGDKSRQEEIYRHLPVAPSRFLASANPTSQANYYATDVSMRTRSINFLAYGVVAAAALDDLLISRPVKLIVPENGLIALNAPLTPRRIGSLSTRTTHPHYLALIQTVLDVVGLNVKIVNPYRHKTKGEMILECCDQGTLNSIIDRTVSCGKWKRTGVQCGRCVPCLIRRASYHAAGIPDRTTYRSVNLPSVLTAGTHRDDLLAMVLASRKAARASSEELRSWVSMSGPLPTATEEREAHFSVFRRGMAEVQAYLASLGLV